MNKNAMALAQDAYMIVNGYAFLKQNGITVVNLNKENSVAVLDAKGNAIETTMDDIELAIVQGYYQDSLEYERYLNA